MSIELCEKPKASVWNRELTPWLSGWLNILRTPIGWLAVLGGFSLLVGLLVGQQGWPVLVMCVSVLTLGCIWPKLQMLAVVPELDFSDESVTEDDRFQVIVRLRNRFPVPVWGLKVQGLDQLCEAKTIGFVSPLATTTFRWNARAAVRGHYPAQSPAIATGFPFGLIECRRELPQVKSLTVVPKLSEKNIAVNCESGSSLHQSNQNEVTPNGHLRGLRAYRHGDMMKKCHWAQTARTGSLVVREDELPKAHRVVIRLDSSWFENQFAAELAFRSCLNLVKQFQKQAMPVDFVLDGKEHRLAGGKRDLEKLLNQCCTWSWQGVVNHESSSVLDLDPKELKRHLTRSKSEQRSCIRPIVQQGLPSSRSISRRAIRPYMPAAYETQALANEAFVTFDKIQAEVAKSA